MGFHFNENKWKYLTVAKSKIFLQIKYTVRENISKYTILSINNWSAK